jgi:hypothetical protein
MEYTKIWHARHAPLDQQDASKRWCLTRMRRLMYGPSPADLDIDGLIHKVHSQIVVSSLIVRVRHIKKTQPCMTIFFSVILTVLVLITAPPTLRHI